MHRQDDLKGLTSNPTIFEKAIDGSDDYDDLFRESAPQADRADDIFDGSRSADIGDAARVFAPSTTHERHDGYVSIEVSPRSRTTRKATVAEAQRLWKTLDRPNVMVKIPGTAEGIPAIEQASPTGININITLLFSHDATRR